MPPVSVEQLRALKKKEQDFSTNPDFIAFCNLMGRLAFDKSIRNYGKKFQKSLQDYSEALYHVMRDPDDPENREEIEDALDTVEEMGSFLFTTAPEEQLDDDEAGLDDDLYKEEPQNTHSLLLKLIEENFVPSDQTKYKKGLIAVSKIGGLELDLEALDENKIDDKAFSNKKRELSDRAEQRENDRERQKEEQARKEQERRMKAAAEKKRRAQEEKEWEEYRQKKREEEARKQEEEARRQEEEARRQEEEARKQKELEEARVRREQESLKRREEEARMTPAQKLAAEKQRKLERERKMEKLREEAEKCENAYRSPDLSQHDRKATLAFAAAVQDAFLRMETNENIDVGYKTIDAHAMNLLNGGGMKVQEFYGKIDDLARQTPEEVLSTLSWHEKEAQKHPDAEPGSKERAEKILRQMSQTKRIRGDSEEYTRLVEIMERHAGAEQLPDSGEQYLATVVADKYLSADYKLARPRKTAVGRTRLACCLAFKKQTMGKKQFADWCQRYNLNPIEIGLTSEVQKEAKEHFRQNGQLTARDFARVTAIGMMREEAKRQGVDFVVEQEKLNAQIAKVEKDARFRAAMKDLSKPEAMEELATKALRGGFDSLDGYAPKAKEAKKIEDQGKDISG